MSDRLPSGGHKDRRTVKPELSHPMVPLTEVPAPLRLKRPPLPQKSAKRTFPSRDRQDGIASPSGRHSTGNRGRHSVGNGDRRPVSHWRLWGSFASLCLVNLVCAVDSSILSVALPVISQDLQGSTAQAFWAGTSFLLASAVLQPLWALLSQIMGRMEMLLAALALFTLGTCLAILAEGFALLLAARSVQGCGGGGLVALTYVIVTDLVTLRERGKWFGLIALQWAVGGALGPVVGGIIAQHNWRWIFWMNIPFCLFAFVAIPSSFSTHRPEKGSEKGRLSRLCELDWFGVVLFIAALTCFLVPLTWGGVIYSWASAATLAPLILGAAGLLAFLAYNALVAEDPFIRTSLFSNATARAAYFGAVSHGFLVFCLLFYLPLYFQSAQNYSAVLSGVAILPYSLTTGLSVILTGLLIRKTGTFRLCIRVGWPLTTLGMGLLLLLEQGTPVLVWLCLGVVGGVGLGIVWSAGSFAAQASASAADLPFAAAMFTFLRALGQTLGVALGGVIFQNVFRQKIAGNPSYAPYAAQWAQEASALVSVVNTLEGLGQKAMGELLLSAYVQSFRVIWLVMSIVSLVATIVNFIWVKDVALGHRPATTEPCPQCGKHYIVTIEHYVQGGKKRTIKTVRYPGKHDWI